MSIRMMCDKSTPGAVLDSYWSKPATAGGAGREIWVVESHVGKVLSLREMNGYDDSDFYALVWDEAKGDAVEVMYASTRGWTYPNGASIDATPEVLAAYKAKCDAEAVRQAARHAEREALRPLKGRTVKMVRTYKPRTKGKAGATIGEVGEVFWYGEARDFAMSSGRVPRNGYIARGRQMGKLAASFGFGDVREGKRVGVKFTDGRKVFTSAMNVEVVEESVTAD